MTEPIAIIVAAVITGIFAILGAYITVAHRQSSTAQTRPAFDLLNFAALAAIFVILFSIGIGFIGALYGNDRLADFAQEVGTASLFATFFAVLLRLFF